MYKENNRKIDISILFWSFTIIATVFEVIGGCIWIFAHKTGIINGSLSADYISAASTLKVDDFMGIFYALLIKVFGHGPILFLIQMILVMASVVWLLKVLGVKLWKAAVLGAFVTFYPAVLQAEWTLLPNAIVLAGLILLIAGVISGNVAITVAALLVVVFSNRELGLLVGLGLILFLIVRSFREKRKIVATLTLVVVTVGVAFFASKMISAPDEYGRVEKSFSYLCVQRLALGHLNESSEATLLYHGRDFHDEMIEADRTAEKLATVFAREFKDYAGDYELNEMYHYLYENALSKGPGYYGKPIIKDFCKYLFTPFSVGLVYFCGINETLIYNSLMAFGVGESNLFFLLFYVSELALAVTMIIGIVGAIRKMFRKEIKGERVTWILLFLIINVAVALCGTFCEFRGFDYMNSLFVIVSVPIIGTILVEGKA